ncbi:MAG: hypothetical protein ABI741_01130 [Ferruginibacter sp.]
MTTKKILYNLIAAAFFLSSCQKDLDEFIPDPGAAGPDSTWFNTITTTMPVATLKNKLLLDIQRDSFLLNPGTVTVTTTGSGLQCSIAQGVILDPIGQPVVGKVYLETHLLKKKGDIIRMGTPTISNGSMLVSGGEFFIRLIKDGVELQLSTNGHINVKYDDPPVSGLMGLFNGIEANPAAPFNWLPNMDTLNNRVYTFNQSYEVLTNRLHWINCDYFYDTSSATPRTTVSAVLPAHYTNANTVAYTVFNDLRSVIGMYGNDVSRKFSTGQLPSNKQVTVIIISKQGDDYYLGHQQALTMTPTAGTIGDQQVAVTPVKTSFENIQAYLNTL